MRRSAVGVQIDPKYKTDHALISGIYSGIDSEFPFSDSLDHFAGRYGAKGSSLMFNDQAEPLVSQLYLSLPDLSALIVEFMEKFGQDEQVTIQALGGRKRILSSCPKKKAAAAGLAVTGKPLAKRASGTGSALHG